MGYEYLHGSMFGSFYRPCEILERRPNDELKIRFYDPIAEEDSVRIVKSDEVREDVEEEPPSDTLDLKGLRDYANSAMAESKKIRIPPHTCPLINEVIEVLSQSHDPAMLPLIEKMEALRQEMMNLRDVGKRFKTIANRIRFQVSKSYAAERKLK